MFSESSLRRTLKSYFDYYLHARTHLALSKDTPEPRAIQPPQLGQVVEVPEDSITVTSDELLEALFTRENPESHQKLTLDKRTAF